jgi:Flp pilus assembly secretin CpaC
MPKATRVFVGFLMLAGMMSSPAMGQIAPAPGYTVIRSQYLRLPFTTDIVRLAVGDESIASAELVNNREVLILGRETGRTTLIIWFANGVVQSYTLTIQRDLSVLQAALTRINPTIQVESAPDRDALILTGVVPNVAISQLAETITRNYLAADQSRARAFLGAPQGAIATPPTVPAAPQAPPPPGQAAPAQPAPAPPAAPPPAVQGPLPPSGTVINLIQLETLPPLPEDKIRDAIASLGGGNVTIRRVLKGNVRDDTADTLVFEGTVPNQVALVRVLETAARLFTGQAISQEDLRVVADESGALSRAEAGGQGQAGGAFGGGGGLGGGAGGGLFGGGGGRALSNQIERNIARATVIEAGDRILSFIRVADLPQIRVDIRLMEVSRSKLRSFDPQSVLAVSSLNQAGVSLTSPQRGQVSTAGINKAAIQDVLAFLGGGLFNEVQLVARHVVIDSAFALLEREGIAHALSSPSITVLSGEQAMFLVGGEVPIPLAFSPFFGAVTQTAPNQTQTTTGAPFGIFSSVLFESFGVQLSIRPLVGDDDSITLDVQPRVRTPDAVLTDQIRQSTGSALPTTAFLTRLLSTSSRLQDGQALLIGGLMSATSNANRSSTPAVRDVPGLGQLFDSRNTSDNSTELVVLVNPVILRTPVPDVGLWAFPTRDELIRPLLGQGPGSGVTAAAGR